MSEISLSEDQLAILRMILHDHLSPETEVWLFGSRATGKAKPYSDIDLAIKASSPLSIKVLAQLMEDFESSALPYKVDMVDWYAIDDDFKKIIQRDQKRVI